MRRRLRVSTIVVLAVDTLGALQQVVGTTHCHVQTAQMQVSGVCWQGLGLRYLSISRGRQARASKANVTAVFFPNRKYTRIHGNSVKHRLLMTNANKSYTNTGVYATPLPQALVFTYHANKEYIINGGTKRGRISALNSGLDLPRLL